jgi:uncharacterized protein (TIGR04255 family)
MATSAKFDPLFPAHAIERCGITIVFREPVPRKAFERFAGRAAQVSSRKGLQRTPSSQIGISVDLATGMVGPVHADAQPQTFSLPDQSATLFLSPHVIVWQNSRYVRWSPFVGQFQDLVSSTLSEFLELTSLAAVKLEYWDRFNWTGAWTDFDATQLIRPSAWAVINGWPQWRRQWHSHAGWFEPADECRRLTNVNVDVGEAAGKPTVGVYTMMQDEPNIPEYGSTDVKDLDDKFVFARLEILHLALKSVLGSVLQDEMIRRISLNAEAGA